MFRTCSVPKLSKQLFLTNSLLIISQISNIITVTFKKNIIPCKKFKFQIKSIFPHSFKTLSIFILSCNHTDFKVKNKIISHGGYFQSLIFFFFLDFTVSESKTLFRIQHGNCFQYLFYFQILPFDCFPSLIDFTISPQELFFLDSFFLDLQTAFFSNFLFSLQKLFTTFFFEFFVQTHISRHFIHFFQIFFSVLRNFYNNFQFSFYVFRNFYNIIHLSTSLF